MWLNPTALICARFIAGFGSSGNLIICPLYSSEVASVRARGALGSLLTFSNNLGIGIIYILGAYLSYFTVLVVMLCIPFLSFIMMSRMPESPSFLVKTKQIKVWITVLLIRYKLLTIFHINIVTTGVELVKERRK